MSTQAAQILGQTARRIDDSYTDAELAELVSSTRTGSLLRSAAKLVQMKRR